MKLNRIKAFLCYALLSCGFAFASDAPLMSDGSAEHWYYVSFRNGDNVMQDQGNGAIIVTSRIRGGRTTQMWKLEGSLDDFIMRNAEGRVVSYTDYLIATDDESQASHFTLVKSTYPDYTSDWEIEYKANNQHVREAQVK